MLAIRPRKASNKWEDRKWPHPALELAVWGSRRLMTSPAWPWDGAPGRSNAGSAPERIRFSDLPSSTPAKPRSSWQRERWVALRPVLASWTCFSLSGSAGRPAVSSGMNLRGAGRGEGKLGARGFAKLLAVWRLRPLLFSLPWVLYTSVAPPGYLRALRARTGVPW